MQFIVKNLKEYLSTIEVIINANIYEEIALIYALDIDINKNTVNELPEKYPCIVSIEIDESVSSNRRYAMASCNFTYQYDLLEGYEYQAKLKKLDELDLMLTFLLDLTKKGNKDKHILKEIEETRLGIEFIEKQLF